MAQVVNEAPFEHADAITPKKPKLKLVSETINDATLIGDQHAPEALAVLASKITIMQANGRRTPGNLWKLMTGTVGQLIQHHLSKHPVAAEKDGLAYVYAQGAKAGKATSTGKVTQFGWRVQNKIEAVTAFFADVDGTDKAQRVAELIHKYGWFGLVYTTHSHAAKKTEDGDRFRVILFLEEPYRFPTDDDDSRRQAVAEWQSRYACMCELLGLDEIDSSAMNLHQMMYTPRRASDDAEKEHYIIAGRALRIEDMPKGDASKYRKAGPSGPRRETTAMDSGKPSVLEDGFDLRDWWDDGGRHIMLDTLLDYLGWDARGVSGDGQHILCPNDAAHSNPGDPDDRGTWAVEGDEGALIYCHHDHCLHMCTWDFIRLLEENIADGMAVLPDGYDSLSALLCEPALYPEIDGEELDFDPADFGAVEEIEIEFLGTHHKVKRAFKPVVENDRAGDDHYAALYAGVEKAGNKRLAVEKLTELMESHGLHDGNKRKALAKRGAQMLKEDRAAYAAHKAEEKRKGAEEALDREDLANPSMDPAEPLGDDLESSLATLRMRFAPVDLNGKFRVVRKPDLNAFNSDFDSTIVVYTKQDFLDLRLDRQLADGESLIDPAKEFLGMEKRKSGLVFAPPPLVPGANDFNMYQGRKLVPQKGKHGDKRDFPTLDAFVRDVVCDGDAKKYEWLMLWMAHMVQFPGEKPGTAVIATGEGGVGKGTMGAILMKLAAPHCKQLENESHVVGQFAGEHLSKCVLVWVNEAVFGLSPKVSSALKALVDSNAIQVEAKGMNLITVPSYSRYYIDSNAAVPILIENNGSERRYFVLLFSDEKKQDLNYFKNVRTAIEGDEMAALLGYLEEYDPVPAGLAWDAVRTAPETTERRVMGVHSMRGAMRRLKEVLEEGQVTLPSPEGMETFTADAKGRLRVPRARFRGYIAAAGDKRRSEDADVEGMFRRLFHDAEMKVARGTVGKNQDTWWWEFPAEAVGVADSNFGTDGEAGEGGNADAKAGEAEA